MAITNFIPTVWSETLLHALDRKYVGVANCNREYEGDIRELGSTVRICGVNPVTVANYQKNTDISAPEVLSDNFTDLVINYAKYFNFQIDDIDRAQTSPKLMEAALRNAATALANEADKTVYSTVNDATNYIYNTSTTVDNVIDTLLEARTFLMNNGVTNPEDIVFEVSPEIAAMIFKAKMNLASDNTATLENGCVGKVAGCKVFVSANISVDEDPESVSHLCVARTRRAVAFAEQLSEIEAYRPEQRFADAMKGLYLYGCKIIYPNEYTVMKMTIV